MTIRLAFCGSSGTGKSTLATAIATELSLPMCPVGSREVSKSMGFDSPYDVDKAGQREEFQRRLLIQKTVWERDHPAGFVTDRTHLDNFAYTLMHKPGLAADPDFAAAAYDATAYYTHVIFCPLGAFQNIGNDPSRVSDAGYHRRYEDYLVKLMQGHGILGFLPSLLWLTATDPDQRLDRVRRFVRL